MARRTLKRKPTTFTENVGREDDTNEVRGRVIEGGDGPMDREEDAVSMGNVEMTAEDGIVDRSEGEHGEGGEGTRRIIKAGEKVKVTVGGQEFEVDQNTAALLRAQSAEFEEQIAGVRRSLPGERERTERTETPADPYEEEDFDVKFMTNPKEYLKSLEKRIRGEVTTQLRGEYTQEQARQRFFAAFYDLNKDLSEMKDVVTTVLMAHNAEIAALPPAQAMKRLAALTREQVDRIVKAARPEDEEEEEGAEETGERRTTTRRTTVEGATRRKPEDEERQGMQRVAPKEQSAPSLSALLRQRRAARSKARTATR